MTKTLSTTTPEKQALNQQPGHQVVIGYVLPCKPVVVHPRHQAGEVGRVLCLDADQHRAEIARRFLEIFETRDVVVRPEQVQESPSSAPGRCGIRRTKYFFSPRSAAPAP
jgi:hypothetical protein